MENHALEQLEQPPSHADRVTIACGRSGRGSDSPVDCHSLPRLHCAYPLHRGDLGQADNATACTEGAQGCGGSATQIVARKLLRRVEMVLDGEETLNPQAMKHISGILKDVRDILTVREDSVDSGAVTVEMEKSVAEFAQ